jgi:phosphate transport system substrate-binding protein
MKKQAKLMVLQLFVLACPLFSVAAWHADAQPYSDSAPPSGKLRISGSSTLGPVVTEIARRFEALHPGVKIEVQSVGSGKGIVDLNSGAADIAMLSRNLLDTERELFYFPVARDGVAVIVHRDNPVKNLSPEQLRAILTGTIRSWRDVGGRDVPIDLIGRGKGQGSTEIVMSRLHLKTEQFTQRRIITTNAAAITAVAEDPAAITITSVGESERSAKAGVPIKLLSYNGVRASSKSIRNNSYDLSRPLALVTRRLPQRLEKQFIDYALSREVIDLHLKYDFVPYE